MDVMALFSGLARLDNELNAAEVARSWQVLDEGKRYIFHLRDDWPWTDGTMVTAADFEWAWKRNLDPVLHGMSHDFCLMWSEQKIITSRRTPIPIVLA